MTQKIDHREAMIKDLETARKISNFTVNFMYEGCVQVNKQAMKAATDRINEGYDMAIEAAKAGTSVDDKENDA